MKIAFLTTDSREHFKDYNRPSPFFGSAPTALIEGFEDLGYPDVHIICCLQARVNPFHRFASNIVCHSVYVPNLGWLKSGYLGCIISIRKLTSVLRPDIVHGQGSERDCALTAVLSGHKNCVTLHGNMRAIANKIKARPFTYYWIQAQIEIFALKKTGGVFCNSHYTQSLTLPLNQRVFSVPNAVRKSFYKIPRKARSIGNGYMNLLMVGVVAEYKQPLEFLRFLQSWRSSPDFPINKCVWVGRAESTSRYASAFLREVDFARKQGWADHIQDLCVERLIEKMDSSDLLVHLPTEEAFGLVVAEGMIRGLPILASQTGGLTDFASIYPNIELVPADSPRDWRRAISSIFLRPAKVPLESWRSKIFYPTDVAKKHIDIYRDLISAS